MEIRTATADFSSPVSGSGPRTASQTLVFARTVNQATVGLLGYSVAFGDNDDHNVGAIQIKVDSSINSNTVTVTATLGLRDWSGDWDDEYLGTIEFAVIADLAAITETPPRGDVIVTGIESSQAVQFFRSARYLDPTHTLPDNAIFLVSRKSTGFRVYVDYDQYAGLPLISKLTGQMTAQTGSTTLTLDPINSGGAIAPGPDASINQGVADSTLNFMLPAAWCDGVVMIRVQVWDQADPAKKSAQFTRTLSFVPVAPLDLFVVGVNYTAQGLNLPAPTESDITTTAMARLRKTYPVGDISVNGYTTLASGEDVNYTIGSGGGCGDGMDDLLDKLDDMQGGSTDIYAAFLPPLGQIQEPNSNIGGCGTTGQAAIFVDQTADVPHEVGHALGRQHAPCNAGTCNPMPANVDDDYPQYGAFPAGSIGVFGFDAATNTAFDPASTADFMAYWGPQWVSAYTYMALGGAFPSNAGGGGGGLSQGHALTRVPVEMLSFKLLVTRARNVTRHHAFHFQSLAQASPSCGEFTVELLDACRNTLACAPIDCGCKRVGCHCWPKKMTGTIPYPKGARWLVVYEHDRAIYEECIQQPPRVRITTSTEQRDGYLIEWTADTATVEDSVRRGDTSCGLVYLVHWFDDEDDVWRGVMPRTTDTHAIVPARIFRRGPVKIRVLASNGIATGHAEITLTPKQPKPGQTTLYLAGNDCGADANTHVMRVTAVDDMGRHPIPRAVYWYDEHGTEVGRGPELDLRRLSDGRHTLRAVVRTDDGQTLAKSWHVNRFSRGHRVAGEAGEPHVARSKPPRNRPPHRKRGDKR